MSNKKMTNKKQNKLLIIGKPYQSINIGPNNFLIPKKIKFNFEEPEQNIEKVIAPYFSPNSHYTFPIQYFSLSSFSPSNQKLNNQILTKIATFASEASKELLSFTESRSIILKCSEIVNSILIFTNYFKFAQFDINFSEVFYSTFHQQIVNNDNFVRVLITIISDIIIRSIKENSPLNTEEQRAIILVDHSDLINDDFSAGIGRELSNFFGQIIKQKVDNNNKRQKYIEMFESFHTFFHSVPPSCVHLLRAVSIPFTTIVIGENSEFFISSVGSTIFSDNSAIDTFFSVISASTPITDYTAFVKSMIADGVDISRMIDLHRFIGRQSVHMRHIVERFLKKRLQKNEKQASASFCQMIDSEFRNGRFRENLVQELGLIQDKLGFEAAHARLMLRRAACGTFACDERFIKEYACFYADEHAENFALIANDVADGNRLVADFRSAEKNVPNFIEFHVFFWKFFPVERVAFRFPEVVRPFIASFSDFARKKQPQKRLDWILEASECEMQIDDFTIFANGVTAAVLLTLNKGTIEADKIRAELNADSKLDVEAILAQFVAQKGGCIVIKRIENGTPFFEINRKLNSFGTKKRIVQTHTAVHVDRNQIQEIDACLDSIVTKSSKIDAEILALLKKVEKMDRKEIVSRVQKAMMFPIEDEIVNERLERLAVRNFVAKDTLDENVYHYVA